MSFDQAAIIGLLVCMFAVFALERFRVEVVALTGLTAGFLLGLIPIQNVFAGFSSPAVVTVVEILLIVGVLARARVVERFATTIVERARGERAVLATLCVTAAAVSVFMNNIGALALMFPVALSVCARLQIPPARMLMALSFSTLLGGLCSLTGTPANLVVNDWMISQTGGGFGYFEIGLVGFPVAAAGLVWLIAASPRILGDAGGTPAAPPEPGPSEFLAEAQVPRDSALGGLSLPDAEKRTGLRIHGVFREDRHVFARRGEIVLAHGDVLLVEAELERLDALRASGDLAAAADGERLEVVVMPDSVILGSRIGSLESYAEQGVRVAAFASRRRRIEGRFEDLQIGLGDVLMLAGPREAIRTAAADSGVLPLTVRSQPPRGPQSARSLIFFGLGVAATALELAPPQIAFGAVVVAMAIAGQIQVRPALQDLNWTIVVLLACMIPLGMAVEDTGAARVIANNIVTVLPSSEPMIVAGIVLMLAIAITPFVDNVSTVAVLSPIAAEISARTGTPIEPLLIAVALGASLDFLTPFGHHNNAVVMGAAGYRFSDFPRLGLPLVAIGAAVGMAMIWQVWA
jgi:di/tricarboxylate transporter